MFVKPEYLNPSGSIKDRIALKMIEDAEERGMAEARVHHFGKQYRKHRDCPLLCRMSEGIPVVIYETTPGKIGEEKRKIMRGYGAEVRSLPPEDLAKMKEKSVAGAEVEKPGRQMCLNLEKAHSDHWWARQFSNPANVQAQQETGTEILEQTGGKVDIFIASIGTGGTLAGVAEVLKRENPRVRVVGVQPASSQKKIVPGQPYPRSEVDGGIIAEMVQVPNLVDEVVMVGDSEAVNMTHRLRKEGFFAGVSSGANVLSLFGRRKNTRGPTS